jgi:hypothetical protein
VLPCAYWGSIVRLGEIVADHRYLIRASALTFLLLLSTACDSDSGGGRDLGGGGGGTSCSGAQRACGSSCVDTSSDVAHCGGCYQPCAADEACEAGACVPGAASLCGNGAIDMGEVCDGELLGDASCESQGFGPGALACAKGCADYDRTGCGAPDSCGDGALDGVEVCDGANHGGASCESLGFGPGTLTCLENCAGFDTTACAPPPDPCGNGAIDPGESCDGALLGDASCASLGYGQGDLACRADCLGFDPAGCAQPPDPCGNGLLDEGEACDGASFGDVSCESLGHWGGTLTCLNQCQTIDDASCVAVCPKDCTSLECGLDPICGEPCGECDAFSVCEDGACTQVCDLEAITTDLVIDVNLDVVPVSGTLTLNGATMPDNTKLYDEDESRGSVVFVSRDTNDWWYVSVGASGAATFDSEVLTGTYDVLFHAASTSYQDVLPDQEVVLLKDVAIQAAWSQTFDLQTVTISGLVTRNGATMPDNTKLYDEDEDRGYVTFARADTHDTLYATLGAQGAAQYFVELFTGEYDVGFDAASRSYQDVLPDQTLSIHEDVTIGSDQSIGFDLQTTIISGAATLNGGTLPDNTKLYDEDEDRGYVTFARVDTGDALYSTIGAQGAGDYTQELFVGDYALGFDAASASYQDVLPDQTIPVQPLLSIQAPTTYNVPLKVVTVSGQVRLNGGTMPNNTKQYDEDEARGYVVFRNPANGDTRYATIGAQGPGLYEATLFAGDYAVLFDAASRSYQDVLPDQTLVLNTGAAFESDQVMDLSLETLTLWGEVRLNGGTMPDNTKLYDEDEARGHLVLRRDETGDTWYLSVGASGPGAFEAEVFHGTYTVLFDGASRSYQDALPDQTVRLEPAVALGASQERSYDLTTVTVSGEVTLNGGTMPDNTKLYDEDEERGHLVFRNRMTGDSLYAPIGAQGAGLYEAEIFTDAYDVLFDAQSQSYQDVLPDQALVVRTGCMDAGDCEHDAADITGTWYFTTSSGYWPDLTIMIEQDGDEIGGSFVSSQGQSGVIETGAREGSGLQFTFYLPSCPVEAFGTVHGGCMMSGTMSCASSTNWFAIRMD